MSRSYLNRREFVVAGAVALWQGNAGAQEATKVPDEFSAVARSKGVSFFASKGNMHFVHVMKPEQGAHLSSLPGAPQQQENQLLLTRQGIRDWWTEFQGKNKNAFSVSNGQFFNNSKEFANAAPLAFTTKTNGNVIAGYGDGREFLGQKMMLTMNGDKHAIHPYDDNVRTIINHPAPTIIVGLKEDVPKSPDSAVGRTFIGGDNERVFVFHSAKSTQAQAVEILRAFGARDMMRLMFDGGGSTNLMTRERQKPLIQTSRTFPHAIGIASGGEEER